MFDDPYGLDLPASRQAMHRRLEIAVTLVPRSSRHTQLLSWFPYLQGYMGAIPGYYYSRPR